MKVEINRISGWQRALNAARTTVWKRSLGKEPSKRFIESMCRSEHSPLRLVEYDIKFTDIPSYVAGHLVRHHVGCEKFVSTNREDRHGVKPEEVNRLTPVNMQMSVNAQSLIDISRKRLCFKADMETHSVWLMVKDAIADIDPILARYMVPNCVYRGFCPEQDSCGYCSSKHFHDLRTVYMEGLKDAE